MPKEHVIWDMDVVQKAEMNAAEILQQSELWENYEQ
jgi:hypothetical protein